MAGQMAEQEEIELPEHTESEHDAPETAAELERERRHDRTASGRGQCAGG